MSACNLSPLDRPPRSVGFVRPRLVSGLRTGSGSPATPSQVETQWTMSQLRFVTVAGAVPDSHRLPNYLAPSSGRQHLKRLKLTMFVRFTQALAATSPAQSATCGANSRHAPRDFRSAAATMASPMRVSPRSRSISPAERVSATSLFWPSFILPTSRVTSISIPTIALTI